MQCFNAFGFNKQAAATVGDFGIVIGPRGWHSHYIRHELIHHRQIEELGLFALLSKPEWLIEGMAYALSDDPRKELVPRWQAARNEFLAWNRKFNTSEVWKRAKAQ